MNHSILLQLQPGDKIVSDFGLYRHYAIYLGTDQYNQDWVSENQKGVSVRTLWANDYFKSLPERFWIEKFAGTQEERNLAIRRALLETGKPYDLVTYNCEHYANFVQHGVPTSNQVKNVIGITALVALGVAILK